MRSRTSYFSKTLFFGTITRFWPLWVAYLAVWLVALPLTLANELGYEWSTPQDIQYLILNLGMYGGVVISAIAGLLAALAAFNYLYNGRSANAIASLPIRRGGTFLSNMTAGLACLIAADVIVFLTALAVEAYHGAVDANYLLQWLSMVVLQNIFFYGFAVFIAQITGHAYGLVGLYAILNFAAIGTEAVVRHILQQLLFGMHGNVGTLLFLSPMVNILETFQVQAHYVQELAANGVDQISSVTGYSFLSWGTLAAYCVAGVVFLIAAFFLYRRRHMETASDAVAIKPLRPVFKYCIAAACALVIGSILLSIAPAGNGENPALRIAVFMIIGAFIGYFAAEMILRKTFRVFSRRWGGFLASSAVIIALILVCEFDIFGYENRLPEADSVSSVSIMANGENAEITDKGLIADVISVHRSVVENKQMHEQADVWNSQPETDYMRYLYTYLYYDLENGGTMTRFYRIAYNDSAVADKNSDISMLNDLLNTKEALESRKKTSIPISAKTIMNASVDYMDKSTGYYNHIELTAEEAYELYSQCILPDMSDLTIGRIWLGGGAEYESKAYDCTISFDLYEKQADGSTKHDYFYTVPTVDSARTNEWLASRGAELSTYGELAAVYSGETSVRYY